MDILKFSISEINFLSAMRKGNLTISLTMLRQRVSLTQLA